jgi:hypothetical protein
MFFSIVTDAMKDQVGHLFLSLEGDWGRWVLNPEPLEHWPLQYESI